MKKILLIIGIVLGSLVLIYGILFGISKLLTDPIPPHAWYQPRTGEHTPLILAHQAGEGEYPSNSKLGFIEAAAVGVDVLDADVHMTKDGEFILFHDETLEHRTNGSGAVRDKTLAELQTLDFAYNWSQDGGITYPYRGEGITVMTARELFEIFPDTRLGIEIKQVTTEAAKQFCHLIRDYRAEDRTLIASVSQENMDVFRKECPEVATSATESEVKQFYILHRLGLSGFAQIPYSSFQVPEKSGGFTLITNRFTDDAHAHGLHVYAWTIDTPEQTEYFVKLGVDGVNTSYPKRIIEYLNLK